LHLMAHAATLCGSCLRGHGMEHPRDPLHICDVIISFVR
jgi:hypothetical protein